MLPLFDNTSLLPANMESGTRNKRQRLNQPTLPTQPTQPTQPRNQRRTDYDQLLDVLLPLEAPAAMAIPISDDILVSSSAEI